MSYVDRMERGREGGGGRRPDVEQDVSRRVKNTWFPRGRSCLVAGTIPVAAFASSSRRSWRR